MKIVFLIINYIPHQIVLLDSICSNYEAEIYTFQSKEKPKCPEHLNHVHSYQLKDFTKGDLYKKIRNIGPHLIVVAGWLVPEYVWVVKQVRKTKRGIPIVSYSDTQWRATIRQIINCGISNFHLKKAFTHIWVAGMYQYEYARKLGFKKEQIIYNSLSCNSELFNKINIEKKNNSYPKKILFVGRFVKEKGLDLLCDAWEQIDNKKGWTLTLVGGGPLKEQFRNYKGIVLKEWMSQDEIMKEMEKSGCFVITSKFEQWSLVIHEAASAGLPLIATNTCGATPHFLINGFNGYVTSPNVDSIRNSVVKMIGLTDKELINFSQNSRTLSASIRPEFGAAQVMSLIK